MALFVVGTLWFWLLISIAFVSISYMIDDDDPNWGGSLVIILFSIGLFAFGNWQTFKECLLFVSENAWAIIGIFIVYTVVGILWSFAKWYMWLGKKFLQLKAMVLKNEMAYQEMLKSKKSDGECLNFRSRSKTEEQYMIPKFTENKEKIFAWLAYWPFSMVWTFFHNFFRDFFNAIIEKLQGMYTNMIKHVFKEFTVEK